MSNISQKIHQTKRKIKLGIKIANIISWIMNKIQIVKNVLTIKKAIEVSWANAMKKKL